MPYIDCFYVCEDIAHRGPLNIKKFDTLDTAVEVYKSLPSATVKALGVQNTAPLPGSLDFVQCHNGRDVLIQDYKNCSGWDNPEISRMIHELRNHLILQEERSIRFITPEYDDLFTLPDGAKLLLQYPDGSKKAIPCKAYPDGHHFTLGNGSVLHICQFAELCRKNGITYAPAHPLSEDVVNTYEIYQIPRSSPCDYVFLNYEHTKNRVNTADYQLVYRGMLGSRLTLDNIFDLHNMPDRPLPAGMRSVSVSDIIILHQNGKDSAHYVDSIGFFKLPDTFCSSLKSQLKSPPETPLFER
nr:YodL domain-containing protein [Fournierella massiliensis]